MKITFIKCGICHELYSTKRNHCPICCASRIVINRRVKYMNWFKEIELVRSLTQWRSISAIDTAKLASILES